MTALGIVFSNIHDSNVPELTARRTMASIPFGGRYRLIDFPLSNMINSGITKVGVITKSNYQSLMDHVGSGKDWDLARRNGGLIILPPFGVGADAGGELYTSRLEALKGVTNFLRRSVEEYVVLTDCDIVCKVDYADVIERHVATGADVTLVYARTRAEKVEDKCSVFDVAEGGRIHGISMVQPDAGEINRSLNIFVMKRSFLQSVIGEAVAHGYKHFTKDVLAPGAGTMKIYGYEFGGYYAPVSSMLGYYRHNLELLGADVRHELFGDRNIFTKVRASSPTKYGNGAIVKNSLIADGCVVEGEVENSILFRGVKVGRGTAVKNSILMQDTVTGENVTLNCIITDKNVVIRDRRVLSGCDTHPFYIAKGSMI